MLGNGAGADTTELVDCGIYYQRSVLNQKPDHTEFRIDWGNAKSAQFALCFAANTAGSTFCARRAIMLADASTGQGDCCLIKYMVNNYGMMHSFVKVIY